MAERVRISDVARAAGVHSGTVSRALNPATAHLVNATTAKKVRKAAKDLGYIPDVLARGLRTNRSMTVGVLVPDLTNPIFPPLVRGVQAVLEQHGYTALVANTDGSADTERKVFETLIGRRVDGFVVATGLADPFIAEEAAKRGVPIVLANRGSTSLSLPEVVGNDGQGIVAAIDHLVELGHTDVLYLSGPESFITSVVRTEAFSRRAAQVDGLRTEIVYADALSVTAGEAFMEQVLGRDPRPTAVVAGNDLLALGVYRALHAHGLRCPEDVSVIGFNDMPFAEDFAPPLTTVRAPHQAMGLEAARLLVEAIGADGPQPAVSLSLPVSLVVRESTAPPPRKR
ncbi:MAG: LacI family DNA-binding transcriptional regulator [Nocardioidaceae bacterium]|nr:LacI family DNA-binding transcriptional regulator [Nocardioidaceae bacterium]